MSVYRFFFKTSFMKNRLITQDLSFRKTKIKPADLKTSLTITSSVPLQSDHPSSERFKGGDSEVRISLVFRLCCAHSVFLA